MSTTPDGRKATPAPRKGQGPEKIDRDESSRRMRTRFQGPEFERESDSVERVIAAAWENYTHSRKSPHTRKAGAAYADPDYDLAVEWIEAREAIDAAQREHADAARPPRILVICASPRNDKTCPGEN